ncbi:MAG TPA: WhiB family transcriptional regulator [Frankiaceae bacterium]|nr:WhiB family transcriptional regulator [Frankiaceae bacterium]
MFATTLGARIEAEGLTLPCWAVDPDLFFAESPEDIETAKAICLDCPVRAECLDGAVARREPYGVWGGQLVVSGAIVARKRSRGRPRKIAA